MTDAPTQPDLIDGGWPDSAPAYIAAIATDANRTVLLDPIMLRLCGDVRGRRALDVGCGEGRFVRMLGERGASPTGIDPTAAMLSAAVARGGGSFARARAERLPFASASFDLVISYVTLVDIEGYRESIAEMVRVLRPGGALVAANLGFVTASDGWEKTADGTRLYHKVDRYAEERSLLLDWTVHQQVPGYDGPELRIRIRNYHRPLASYMSAYLGAGLILREFLEPVPEDESLRDQYFFEDWFRVPLFNVMKWEKR